MPSLEELTQALPPLQAQAQTLVAQYRQALLEHLPPHPLQEVRHLCTQQSPKQFLQLSETAQKRLIHLTQQLAQALCQELAQHTAPGSPDQLAALVEPYLQASERQLNQLLSLEDLGPISLRVFAAELGSPVLRSLRAQWQVNQSRQAAIQRQISLLETKQQIAAAEARWDELARS
ncbi:MAG: hypothetical protein Q6K70_11295 [Thermostichales cyanobacterium DRC_bins_46]